MTQLELARRTGISRQALGAIESGAYQPGVTAAIAIARALGETVENLFGLEAGDPSRRVRAELLGADKAAPAHRVALARVGGRVVAIAQPAVRVALTPAAGVVELAGKGRTEVETTRTDEEIDATLLIAGCDPAAAILSEWLARHRAPFAAVVLPCSSTRALGAVLEGRAHAAGLHLRDPRSGEYNLAAMRRALGARRAAVVTFARWELGLAIAPERARSIRGVADLARPGVRIVNREQGAGARAALDEALAFIHKQILNENLYRLIGHRGVNVGHAHPFYYEDLALLAGFMPWTPLALLAGLQALSRPRPLDSRLGYLIVWTLAVLIFYNLPQSKRGVYLLAIYPALAALVAIFLIDAIANPPELVRRGARMLAVATGGFFVVAAAASAFGVVLLFVAPAGLLWILGRFDILLAQLPANLRLEFVKWLPLGIAIPLFVAGLGWRLCRTRATVAKVFFATALGFAAMAVAVNCVVEPAVADTLTLRGFARQALATAGANPIGYIGSLDYDFAFYSGRNIRFVTTLDAPYEYVICSEDDFRLLGPRMRAEYERVAISNPTAFDGTSRMLLLRRVSGPESPPAAHAGAAPKSGV
ncbi:helix-turn-helix domain-containing protein [bacterium]|nr:helix-turn-helix domain-containing protein [bacterium]